MMFNQDTTQQIIAGLAMIIVFLATQSYIQQFVSNYKLFFLIGGILLFALSPIISHKIHNGN